MTNEAIKNKVREIYPGIEIPKQKYFTNYFYGYYGSKTLHFQKIYKPLTGKLGWEEYEYTGDSDCPVEVHIRFID